jgi:hypothetical protein
MATHISTLLHAAVLLGLAWAARLSALGPGWHDVAAWLLVVSSALIGAKDTLNWLTGVQDEFGEKAKTAPLGALGALGRQLVSVSSSQASSQRCDARCQRLGSLAHIGMTERRQPRRSPRSAHGIGHAPTLRSTRIAAITHARARRGPVTLGNPLGLLAPGAA